MIEELKLGKLYRVTQSNNRWDDELVYFNTPQQIFNYCVAIKFDPLIHLPKFINFNNAFLYIGTERYYNKIYDCDYFFHKFLFDNKTIFFPLTEEFIEAC